MVGHCLPAGQAGFENAGLQVALAGAVQSLGKIKSMNKIHIAIGVSDVVRSVEDYTRRLGCPPKIVVPNEYALWRTDSINFSIRHDTQGAGELRHLGWEDPSALQFTKETDVNGIVWERFSEELQAKEIKDTWPQSAPKL